MSTEERELKLTPVAAALLDRLAALDELGPFRVVERRFERQRNTFFDTRGRTLRAADVGFRRREIEGQPLATWSLKGQGTRARGVTARTEIELHLAADMTPGLALSALRDAARQRGAPLLAEQVADALEDGWPLADPMLVTETDREVRDLEAAERGWRAEMTLDRVRLVGHDYAENEIEVELRRGDEQTLEAARAAIEGLGEVRESDGSKLSRALQHLAVCACLV